MRLVIDADPEPTPELAEKRLGAVVKGYDVRPEVKEQVESVGGKFVTLGMETDHASGTGGYAAAQSEDFYRRQQELLGDTIGESDVVITTAAVPGRRAPLLVARSMVERMRPGSVIVDLAAETGGNCELTRAGAEVEHAGVLILGPVNLASEVPYHASQLYSRNLTSLLEHVTDREGRLQLDPEDPIVAGTLVAHEGSVTSPRVRDQLQHAEEPL